MGTLKPAMAAYDFAIRDHLPGLPSDTGGMVQTKYNGMLTVVLWDDTRDGFVAGSPRGRCYYSQGDDRGHPVTDYFNARIEQFKDLALIGETHVVRENKGRKYMTEFNKSMSIIKNPKSRSDVERIQLAVFDYRVRTLQGEFYKREPRYLDRFMTMKNEFGFAIGVDADRVHLPDLLEVDDDFESSCSSVQAFWDEYITERGFEGLVMHTKRDEEYKIKFRDTLDVAIIAFRMEEDNSPVCPSCGAHFDRIRLVQLVRQGRLPREKWFGEEGRQTRSVRAGQPCPLCGTATVSGPGAILGARIALMTSDGNFVAIADGAQISPLSPILWQIEPLYEEAGYLWIRPQVVIEVSYQDLYVNRMRPVYCYRDNRYQRLARLGLFACDPTSGVCERTSR